MQLVCDIKHLTKRDVKLHHDMNKPPYKHVSERYLT